MKHQSIVDERTLRVHDDVLVYRRGGAKRRVAVTLQRRALQADSFQTTACWWLSLAALVGVGLSSVLAW